MTGKMKKMILSILPFFILLGCNQEENDVQRPSIYGTWQLSESYIIFESDGAGGAKFLGEFREVPNEDKYEFTIAFNNTFSSTKFSSCNGGNVKYDDVQIAFEYGCEEFIKSPLGAFSYKYHFEENGNKLFLHPNFLSCIEGCGDRFQKIAEPGSGE